MTNRKKNTRSLSRGLGFTALSLALAPTLATTGCTANASSSPSDNVPGANAAVRAPMAVKAAPVVITPRYGTVRLPRAEHPLARPEFDQGRLDPQKRIANLALFLGMSAEQRKDRDALAAAQLDRTSPLYHHWLTPETYRARFGARPEDIARASAWLTQQGFDVHQTSPLGTRIAFAAKSADLEAAFQTEMHRYLVRGQMHYAMATAPAFPADLAGIVLGLHNSNDFYPKPASRRTNANAYAQRGTPSPHYEINFDGGPDGGFKVLGPTDWAAAYDVAKLYSPGIAGKALDGTGVTIGIVGTAAIAQSDIDAFRTTFGLPQRTVTMTLVPDTGMAAGGQGGGGIEAILDVEWSNAIAKGANVNYVFVGQDDGNVDDATFYLLEHNLTPLMSESYGGCELGNSPTDADILEENGTIANLLGITYMAAAGDQGAADCIEFGVSGLYVDMPGSFPGVTSVGGTQFPSPAWDKLGNLDSYTTEAVWNESNNPYTTFMGYQEGVGAGGGGISSIFLRPSYQSALSTCDTIGTLPTPTTQAMRQVPDVALSAASGTPGYFIECTFDDSTGDCSSTGGMAQGTGIGGTSASSPSFTGLVAILNQAVGERLGNINPILYQLEAAAPTAAPFNDIILGNNEVVCGPAGQGEGGAPEGGLWPEAGCSASGVEGYAAVPGYDCASGIGSVDGYNLVTAWLGAVKTDTTLVPAPTQTTEGAEVTLTASVNVDGANANPVGGIVTFGFRTYTVGGQIDLSWELGSAAITGGTATGGQAVLVTTIPPGISNPGHQHVDVVASYGGDVNHLASVSATATVNFAPLTLAIVPAALTLQPNGSQSFTTTGGTPPVRWFIAVDTTANYTNGYYNGSTIDEVDGGFVAGPMSGYVEVTALDKFGAEAIAEVTVGGPTTPAPWDPDAGIDAGMDSGVHHVTTTPDAGSDATTQDAAKETGSIVEDAGAPEDAVAHASHDAGKASSSSGGCSVANAPGSTGGTPLGALGGLVFGLGLASRRRRATR